MRYATEYWTRDAGGEVLIYRCHYRTLTQCKLAAQFASHVGEDARLGRGSEVHVLRLSDMTYLGFFHRGRWVT